jgi:hypothetical protein
LHLSAFGTKEDGKLVENISPEDVFGDVITAINFYQDAMTGDVDDGSIKLSLLWW